MIKIDRENIVENIFKYDLKKNSKHTSISEVCLLTIKSLMPDIKDRGNRINYKRFIEEVELWKFYRSNDYEALLNIVNKEYKDNYYDVLDDEIYSRLLPIIVSNDNFEVLEDELIKNTLFTTGNIKTLLEWLMIARYISLAGLSEDEILEELKDYIINLEQKEFLSRYGKIYRVGIEEKDNNFIIEFEREKINIINLLNGIPTKDYQDLSTILNNEKGSIVDILTGENLEDIEIHQYYKNFNNYILRLNKGRINPESLVIKEYKLPDVFKFNKGDKFYHSLLNNCEVIEKEAKDNTLTSIISTKTGIYVFEKAQS